MLKQIEKNTNKRKPTSPASSELEIGDVIFARDNKWLSRAIRFVTKSEWSHVAFYLGEGQVIDTDAFRNVSIHHLEHFETWEPLRYEEMTDSTLNGIISYMVARLNAPYDYHQIAGFLFEALGFRNTWYMKGKYTCAALIDRAFLSEGIDLVPYRVDGDVWPEDMYGSWLLSQIR